MKTPKTPIEQIKSDIYEEIFETLDSESLYNVMSALDKLEGLAHQEGYEQALKDHMG